MSDPTKEKLIAACKRAAEVFDYYSRIHDKAGKFEKARANARQRDALLDVIKEAAAEPITLPEPRREAVKRPSREQWLMAANHLDRLTYGREGRDQSDQIKAVAAWLREMAEVEWPSDHDLCRCAKRLEHIGEEADLKYFDSGMFRRVAAMLRKLAG